MDVAHMGQACGPDGGTGQPQQLPLSEESLREIGRNISGKFPSDPGMSVEAILRQNDILTAIVRSAQANGVPQAHMTAACNALTAFLEKCRTSPVSGLRSLSRPDYLWNEIFNIFLERSDRAKPKPMRQLLTTLGSVILTDLDRESARDTRNTAVTRIIGIIFKQEAHARVKPAIQALDYFLDKRVIALEDLILLVQSWLIRSPTSVRGTIRMDAPGLSLGQQHPEGVMRELGYYLEVIAYAILCWMPEPDVAPAAGNLFIVLYKYQQNPSCQKDHDKPYANIGSAWLRPLLNYAENSLNSLGNLKQHIFPGLFRMKSANFMLFLEHLGIKEVLSGALPSDDARAATLLTALQVGKEIGLVEDRQDQADNFISSKTELIIIPDALMRSLLTHASATIRLAAFSLLTASPFTTRPFDQNVLCLLEQHTPFFCADTDAKFRTDVLSHTKRLIDRLRGGVSFLTKDVERSEKAISRQPKLDTRKEGPFDEHLKAARLALDQHVRFVKWFILFLSTELQPTASYQRHVTALKAFTIVLQSGIDGDIPTANLSRPTQGEVKWPLNISLFTPLLVRVLLDLLTDPFDDVRNGAAQILKMAPLESGYLYKSTSSAETVPAHPRIVIIDGDCSTTSQSVYTADTRRVLPMDISDFLASLERTMYRSGRADHADGVARTYEIIFDMSSRWKLTSLESDEGKHYGSIQASIVSQLVSCIEAGLAIAKKDLPFAVLHSPVHGHLAAIRLILDRNNFYQTLSTLDLNQIYVWQQLHRRIFQFCAEMWDCVKHVLSNDSPEGLIPEDFDDETDIGTKDILSYSWRALKESSLVLRAIISKATYGSLPGNSILDENGFIAIGQLSFDQLAELRHRGAFSTVSLTFAACCQRCYKESDLHEIPARWYQATLFCIRDQASTTTRRSAGIPSLMTGILSAEPGGPLFKRILSELLMEARLPVAPSIKETVKLPQVHSLNCLKDTFADSRLGPCSEPYLAEALELAVNCLSSDIWAIRNCGIMLFRSLADRLFGTNESRSKDFTTTDKKSSKLSWIRFPDLPRLLHKVLDEDDSSSPEAVFPAMDIIRRGGPPTQMEEQLRGLILFHTGSDIWHVRDMAARTLCSLLQGPDLAKSVEHLMELPRKKQNEINGRLLTARYLLQRYLPLDIHDFEDTIDVLLNSLQKFSGPIFREIECYFTKAAFLGVLNVLMETCLRRYIRYDSKAYSFNHKFQKFREEMYFTGLLNECLSPLGILEAPSKAPESWSLYRRSVVQSIILENCLSGQHLNLLQPLEKLARHDPDTLSDAIELLGSIYTAKPGAKNGASDVVTILLRVLQVSQSTEAKACATHWIAELCESADVQLLDSFASLGSSNANITQMTFLGSGDPTSFGSPSLTNAELRLLGFQLAGQCGCEATLPMGLIRELKAWSIALHEAGQENNDFATRMAAAQSLSAFKTGFRIPDKPPRTDVALLSVYIALYDTLNDDDDNIRDVGAVVVSWILSNPTLPKRTASFVPLSASLRLSQWLPLQFPDSSHLHMEAVRRLTLSRSYPVPASGDIGRMIPIPFKDLLANATRDDTSLFIEERQNLFIDDAREAEIWSQILLELESTAMDEQLSKAYATWVKEGLSTLLEKTETEVDGPLGWTSKSEVFALGVNVIAGAMVLLQWMKDGDASFGSREEVFAMLKDLVESGKRSALHELWLQRIGRIVEASP